MPSTTRVVTFPGSAAIGEAKYDLISKVLKIRFSRSGKTKDGKWKPSTWEFQGVPREEFAALTIADSPGGYFNQNIRLTYPHTRVSPPPEA
jgi:KTSC domain-containing protein